MTEAYLCVACISDLICDVLSNRLKSVVYKVIYQVPRMVFSFCYAVSVCTCVVNTCMTIKVQHVQHLPIHFYHDLTMHCLLCCNNYHYQALLNQQLLYL